MNYPDLYYLKPDQPIDLDALRAALVIVCDDPVLFAAVERDMRVEPWLTLPAGQIAAEAARHEYDAKSGVSVVIPDFNYGRFIPQALDSLLAQTRLPNEIVVVDDASTDDSAQVVDEYIRARKSGSLIRQIRLARNGGVANARNTGIHHTTQEHIVCFDPDDLLEPAYIETMHQAMLADRSLGIAYCPGSIISDQPMNHGALDFGEFSWAFMTTPNETPYTCIPSHAMFRRAMWKRCNGYQRTYKNAEEVDFWVRGLATGWNAKRVTTDKLFVYRVHSDSLSRNNPYTPIDHYKPWMHDKIYPFAAPAFKTDLIIPDYTRPSVSVIIPVGPGHARYLPSALESVLGQNIRSWEVIVINDGAGELPIESYPFVRVLDGGSRGVANARNMGIDEARAPLVCFLDADDYLLPHALQHMLSSYAVGNAGYIYGDWITIGADGKQERQEASEFEQDLRAGRGFYSGVTVLMATEDARKLKFDDSTDGFEDWDYFIRASINGICGRRIPYPTFGYRLHAGTRREKSQKRKTEILGVFQERYGEYMRGEKQMATCCGGNGDALIAAKNAIMGIAPNAPITREGLVQMEYLGQQVSVTYFNRYIGGVWPHDRYAHDVAGVYGVEAKDVERMANTGKWRVVEMVFTPAPEPAPPLDFDAIKAKAEASIPKQVDIEQQLKVESVSLVTNADTGAVESSVRTMPKRIKRGKRNV